MFSISFMYKANDCYQKKDYKPRQLPQLIINEICKYLYHFLNTELISFLKIYPVQTKKFLDQYRPPMFNNLPTSDIIRVAKPLLIYPFCKNTTNDYHWCTDYCRRWKNIPK